MFTNGDKAPKKTTPTMPSTSALHVWICTCAIGYFKKNKNDGITNRQMIAFISWCHMMGHIHNMISKRLAQTEVRNPHAMHGYVTWPQLPFWSPQSNHNSLPASRTNQSRGLNPGPIVRRIQSFSNPTIKNASGQRKATANMTALAVHVMTNYMNF